MPLRDLKTKAQDILGGDLRSLARLLRWIDDGLPNARELLKLLVPHAGRATVIGITGNPGAGKSTLTDHLIRQYRDRSLRVAVVAVDPSSPFSGGAILGDRIRMQRHATDEGVFIRSFATRGHLGGLGQTTLDVVLALDAAGWDVVLVETVGVGQDEVEVQRLAHTTVVVCTPGMGDGIQAIKAGILEIADVFAVNKADRQGAERTVRDLEQMLDLGRQLDNSAKATRSMGLHPFGQTLQANTHLAGWSPRVIRTVATSGEGISNLMDAIDAHQDVYRKASRDEPFIKNRNRQIFIDIFRRTLLSRGWAYLMRPDQLEQLVQQLLDGVADPYSLAEKAVSDLNSND